MARQRFNAMQAVTTQALALALVDMDNADVRALDDPAAEADAIAIRRQIDRLQAWAIARWDRDMFARLFDRAINPEAQRAALRSRIRQ